MPIKIPDQLPGRFTLENERIPLIFEKRALRQDIRPLQIAILNFMPDKIGTETQLLRSLGNTPLQVEITLLHPSTHKSKNTAEEHLAAFYKTYDEVKDRKFDGLIVTGAPVGHLNYEDVTYWQEFTTIMDWADSHVYSTLFICWAAHAALYHHHLVPKHRLPIKKSGIYMQHLTDPLDPLVRGFDDTFPAPVSRGAEVRHQDLSLKNVSVIAKSDESGLCLAHDSNHRRVYVFNHLEYEADTLQKEYLRDIQAGLNPALPVNYFTNDNPDAGAKITWRAHRNLLFGNWVNLIYQEAPFELGDIAAIAA